MRRILLDFLTQLVDHNSKIFRLLAIFRPPHGLQQPAVCDWLTLMSNEVFQNIELFGSEMNLFAPDNHPALFEIDLKFL